jgi:hypothetical protein
MNERKQKIEIHRRGENLIVIKTKRNFYKFELKLNVSFNEIHNNTRIKSIYEGYLENKLRLRILLLQQRCGHDGAYACRVC